MKKLFLQLRNFPFLSLTEPPRGKGSPLERKNRLFLNIWLIIHFGIPAAFVLSLFFAPPLSISVQLFDILPQSYDSQITKADNVLTERSDREAVILFGSSDFETAKNSALSFYNEFKSAAGVESASLFFDADVIDEIAGYFFNYRFVNAGRDTIELMKSGRADEIAMDALASVYGAFNMIPLDNIDKDPFLLTERRMIEFISSSMLAGGNLGIKDDVLSVQKDGIWYVIFRMTLSPRAISVADISKSIIGEFYSTADLIKDKDSDLEIYFSGFPFHNYESASSAQREIIILCIISLVFILLIFIFILRSPTPIIFSILDILISLILSTAVVFLFFRTIHIFTFIFGTTLIGICIDYSTHFFVSWRGNTALRNGSEIRSFISKSLIMCFISSTLSFFAILFAPFPIFKQFSVFTMVGLISSFLTAYCIYPLIKLPEKSKRHLPEFLHRKKFSIPPVLCKILVFIFTGISVIILFFNPYGIEIKTDLSSLYTMSPFLEESEIKATMVLEHGSSPLYFFISGSSIEETLKNEEQLIIRLEEEIAAGSLSSFAGISIFVPSQESQKITYKAMSALLPLSSMQYDHLGFPQMFSEIFYNEYTDGELYCLPEDVKFWPDVYNLWIGEINGIYYSCVYLFNAKNSSIFKSIADEFDFIHLMNKEEDLNRNLDIITKTIVVIFFIAYFIIAAIIFLTYPLKKSIKICLTPALGILVVLAVLAVRDIPLGFLSIFALILVFGLGTDYAIFMSGSKDGEEKGLTRLAVFLSLLTSCLSFGILTFSSFTPVNIFGFTVAVGLTAAFIFTMLLQGMDTTSN